MIVRSTTVHGVQHVRFEGGDALDYACAPAVKRQLSALVRVDADVVADLDAVEFIDSAGLGVLVGLFKMTHRSGRQLLLAGVRAEILEVMEVVRLDRIFAFADDVPTAVERLRVAR